MSGVTDALTAAEVFWQAHDGLPRQAPGSSDTTRLLLRLVGSLPARPRIVDIGCGTGTAGLLLAADTGGELIGVDTHQPFLDRLLVDAEAAGLADRVRTLYAPMAELPLPAGGADRNIIPYYTIPSVRAVKRVVRSLPYRTSSMRGLGGPVNVFAIETLIDDIAHATGADPVAFRLAHLDDSRARHIVERTAALAGWPGEPAGEGVGWGLGFARYKNMAAYCAVAVRVEVEEAVRVTDAWSALDAGECINPDGAVNQTEGGIIQAISWTLKEAVQFDGAAVAGRDWETYPILRFSEVPAIAVEIVDRPDEPPLGLAEAAQGPTLAAIGNAVRNAIGVRVRQMPITRDAIVAAMELA
jgi:CO/xanthine dehydrogenase Mo-binding subunit